MPRRAAIAPARVRQIDGVPIPTDWPQPKPNGKVRTTAAVATARALIRPKAQHDGRVLSFPPDTLINADTDEYGVMFGDDGAANNRERTPFPGNGSPAGSTPHRKRGEDKHFCNSPRPGMTAKLAELKRRAHIRDDRCTPNPWTAAEAMVLPPVHGGQMAKSKLPAAVETARATLKSKTAGKKNQPVVFAECHDAPQPSIPAKPKRGRARTRPPAHMCEQMPEHSDDAYYAAQAQLRASNPAPVSAAVPPSDYHRGGPRLDADELRRIADLYTEKYGPILSLDQAAQVTKLSSRRSAASSAGASSPRPYSAAAHSGSSPSASLRRRWDEIGQSQEHPSRTAEHHRGSTFVFTAWFARQANQPAAVTAVPPVLLHNLRVLVVDDNAVNRQIMEKWLRGWQDAGRLGRGRNGRDGRAMARRRRRQAARADPARCAHARHRRTHVGRQNPRSS